MTINNRATIDNDLTIEVRGYKIRTSSFVLSNSSNKLPQKPHIIFGKQPQVIYFIF